MLISAGRTLRVHRNYGKHSEVDVEAVDLAQKEPVSGVSWSGTGTTVAVVGKKWDHVYIFSCDGNNIYEEERLPIPNSMYQNCCVFSKKGSHLYTSGLRGTVYIWHCSNSSWGLVGEVGGHCRTTVSTIALDPAEQFICTGDTKGRVTVLERLPSSESPGRLSASSYKPSTVLSSSSSEEISVLQCNPYHPYQPSELAVGHNSGLLEVWDLPSKTLRFSVHSHSATITDIAYSTINGQLMVTSGLDGGVHIVLVMSGEVVKRCAEGHPVHSVEFVKGTQQLLYLTDTAIVNYPLNKSWTKRSREPVSGASLLRFQHSRAPLYESREAYMARSGGNPSKPSPEEKAPRGSVTSSSVCTAPNDGNTPTSVSASRDVTTGSRDVITGSRDVITGSRDVITGSRDVITGSRDVITGSRDVITGSRDTPRSIDVINEEESMFDLSTEGDSSFHISDIINYSDHKFTVTPDAASKKRSVPQDKENLPPNIYSQDSPLTGVLKKRAGLVASTPAQPQSQQINKQYLTPTSYLTKSTERKGMSASSLFSPVDRSGGGGAKSDQSSVGVVQDKLTPSSLAEDSNTPSHLGSNNTPSNLVNTQGVSGSASGSANTNVPSNNAGDVSQIEAIVARQFKEHQQTLLSETRWLKNEIVSQAVQTQFALEDILNVVLERLGGLEQRVTSVEQKVEQVLQNM